MSDYLRRILEDQEALRRMTNPAGQLRSLIDGTIPHQLDQIERNSLAHRIDQLTGANLPQDIDQAYVRLGIGSEVMRFMEQEEQRRKLLYGAVGNGIAEEAERARKLLQGPVEEARRLGLFDPHSEFRRSMDAVLTARETYEKSFRRPEFDEIGRLAREIFNTGALAATAVGALGSTAALEAAKAAAGALGSTAALEAAMGAMRSPWLKVEHAERSAYAFAEMQALGRTLRDYPPFDVTAVASLRSSLGDWRDPITQPSNLFVDPMLRSGFYIERGFNPSLTDFTVPAFDESLDIAGLRVREPDEPDEGNAEDDGLARARRAFATLQDFEVAIRRFIERVMHAAYGDDWMKRQLPPDMLDQWRAKRETAVKAGETERPLIDYADFTDYRQIIERRDNWKDVFKPIFGRPEDVRESFQRLFPLRIATMHARIVTLDDQLLLTVETARVLRAIQTRTT